MAGDYSHIPVLLHEVLTALAPKAGDVFLDGTLGRAGHSIASLQALGLNVERVMKRTGVLGARGATSLLQQIAALPGVKHVRAEHEFQLPPLHDEIPQ